MFYDHALNLITTCLDITVLVIAVFKYQNQSYSYVEVNLALYVLFIQGSKQ